MRRWHVYHQNTSGFTLNIVKVSISTLQHGFMPRRSCLTNVIVAEELITGITDQVEPVDVGYLDLSCVIVY